MGRGRAKAKQTKVARQLKYGGVHSDLGALQAELSSGNHDVAQSRPAVVDEPDEVEDDPYAKYRDDDDEDAPVSRTSGS
jgi:hypothetical protein